MLTVFLLSILKVDDYAQVALTEVENIREQDIVAIKWVHPAAPREFLEIGCDLLILPLIKVWVTLDLVGETLAAHFINDHMILL